MYMKHTFKIVDGKVRDMLVCKEKGQFSEEKPGKQSLTTL